MDRRRKDDWTGRLKAWVDDRRRRLSRSHRPARRGLPSVPPRAAAGEARESPRRPARRAPREGNARRRMVGRRSGGHRRHAVSRAARRPPRRGGSASPGEPPAPRAHAGDVLSPRRRTPVDRHDSLAASRVAPHAGLIEFASHHENHRQALHRRRVGRALGQRQHRRHQLDDRGGHRRRSRRATRRTSTGPSRPRAPRSTAWSRTTPGGARGSSSQKIAGGLAGARGGDRRDDRRRGRHADRRCRKMIQAGPARTLTFGAAAQLARRVRVRGDRSATRWSCASRSASSAASRRGTTRCTRSRRRSRRRSPPAAPSCSSRARSRRSTRSSSPRSSTRSACPPACSTSSPATGRSSARRSPRTPTSTWSRSPAPPAPASASAELAAQTVKRVALELGGKSRQRHPRRRRPRRRRSRAGVGRLLPQLGPDLHRAHPHARAAQPSTTRSTQHRRRGRRGVHASATRSTATTRLGPLVSEAPARPRPRLHPEGHRRGRDARHRRRRAARGPRPRATS